MCPRLRVYAKEDQTCFNSCAALLMFLLFLRRISEMLSGSQSSPVKSDRQSLALMINKLRLTWNNDMCRNMYFAHLGLEPSQSFTCWQTLSVLFLLALCC